MALKFTTSYIEDCLAIFKQYKGLADRAMAQATDEQLFLSLDEQSNSIAIIAKHMAGNRAIAFQKAGRKCLEGARL